MRLALVDKVMVPGLGQGMSSKAESGSDREERLKQALRANLRRRKSQAKGRKSEDAASEPESSE